MDNRQPYPPSAGKPWPAPPSGPPKKRRPAWLWVVGGVLLLLVIVISSTAKHATTSPSPSVAADATLEAPAADVPMSGPAPTVETRRPTAPTATSWTMPNLVGHNLQDAQDAIQALTGDAIFLTKSHDATGAGRHQILDRDWKVCSQNVRTGAKITVDTPIDFGAAKLGERC